MQRCTYCAPLRDEEVRNQSKAGKGKGSGSSRSETSREASLAQLQFFVDVLTKEVDELRRRVTELEGARM